LVVLLLETFKRLAIDKEPESCGPTRKGKTEALTGLDVGQVLSSEIMLNPGADAVEICGRQHSQIRQGENLWDLAESETLSMHPINLRENREIPCLARDEISWARVVKFKDARR
jgi:hypothetical protein